MKLFTGWITAAGLVLSPAAANAQVLGPYEIGGRPYAAVSDFAGPYAAMPPDAPAPRYGLSLLPPQEVYTVVRDSGFSPLGVPHLRGFIYTIAVIDRGGDDGRLVIDARNGRILRFMPAWRTSDNFDEDFGRAGPPAGPRPPGAVSHLASRNATVPLPKAPSPRASETKPLVSKPAVEPAQQSAAVAAKPADAPAVPQAAAPAAAAPQVLPTQEMPKVQGLE